jgi:hypothetical protein
MPQAVSSNSFAKNKQKNEDFSLATKAFSQTLVTSSKVKNWDAAKKLIRLWRTAKKTSGRSSESSTASSASNGAREKSAKAARLSAEGTRQSASIIFCLRNLRWSPEESGRQTLRARFGQAVLLV